MRVQASAGRQAFRSPCSDCQCPSDTSESALHTAVFGDQSRSVPGPKEQRPSVLLPEFLDQAQMALSPWPGPATSLQVSSVPTPRPLPHLPGPPVLSVARAGSPAHSPRCRHVREGGLGGGRGPWRGQEEMGGGACPRKGALTRVGPGARRPLTTDGRPATAAASLPRSLIRIESS